MAVPEWTRDHWRAAHDALLTDWARLKGVPVEVARLYWPTDKPPIHHEPQEATR